MPERRNQVPETVRTADIDGDEQQAHGDGANGQQFAVKDDLANRFPVVDIGGNDQHDRGRRHAYQEREVPDIESPTDLVAHRRQAKPVAHLLAVGQRSREDQKRQKGEPQAISAVSVADQFQAPAGKAGDQPESLGRTLRGFSRISCGIEVEKFR